MKDFTVRVYEQLLDSLQSAGFNFLTFRDFNEPETQKICLRHDVDARKENSLRFAEIQKQRGIRATYYFRTVPESYDERLMKEIEDMGHEIGYHYETMDTCKGNLDLAYDAFCRNLEMFRKVVKIDTICMHGSPMSNFDNRDIWKKFSYKDLGLRAEPYFDIDFNKVYYLTDTGRRWDGARVSIRDKPMGIGACTNKDFLERKYHSTFDIIKDLDRNKFPGQVMMTFHPQRWSEGGYLWYKELLVQNLKNQVKRILVK